MAHANQGFTVYGLMHSVDLLQMHGSSPRPAEQGTCDVQTHQAVFTFEIELNPFHEIHSS